MLITSMRGNTRRVSYGARTMVYLLAGILFLFAFAACDPVMDDMGGKGGKGDNGNDAPPVTGGSGNDTLTGTDASEAFEASVGSDTITSFSLATGNSDTIDFSGFTGDNAVDIGELSFAPSTDGNDLVITGYGDDNMLTLSNAFTSGGAFHANGAPLSLNAAISLLTAATTGPLTGLATVSGQGTVAANTLTAGAGAHLFGFEGDDVLTTHADGSVLFAGNGNDTLNGGVGNDILDGGAGNDTLTGGAGDDTLAGGTGTGDIALYAMSAMLFTIESTGTAPDISYTVATGTETDTLTGIETIRLSGMADALGSLSAALNDIIIDGGEGQDTITLTNDGVTLNLSTATNYRSFETITGGTGNDTITGSTGVETINGGAGDDTINGAGGAGTLNGGPGNDVFTGLGNGTTIDGGADIDTLDLSNASLRGDTVYVNISDASVTVAGGMLASGMVRTTMGGSARDTFTITNVENFYGADDKGFVVHGDEGPNIFEGGTASANDSFYGNGGDDIMVVKEGGIDYFEDFSNEEGNNDRIDLRKYFSQIKNVGGITIARLNNHLQFRIRDLDGNIIFVHLRDVFGSGKPLAGYANAAAVFDAFGDGTLNPADFFIFAE